MYAIRPPPGRKHALVALTLVLLLVSYVYLPPAHETVSLLRHAIHTSTATTSTLATTKTHHLASTANEIPRIVHLVHLKSSPDATTFDLSFQSFLCIYAASQFINPTTIFLHTDYPQQSIDRALQHGSLWTRKILTSFPGTLLINPVTPRTTAGPDNDIPLEHIEHKSDFIRVQQLARYGGIYLDWDVLTLRSPTPLLRAGFAAVVGRQVDDILNNGCMLAHKDSALVALLDREMPRAFTGEWQAHSTLLLTDVAERIAYVPGEVLIMDHKAFAPTSWYFESARELFIEHEILSQENYKDNEEQQQQQEELDGGEAGQIQTKERRRKGGQVGEMGGKGVVPLNAQVNVATVDPFARWENRTRGAEWEMDFSQTYFLHAFKASGIPRFDGVDLAYVLRRRSNYALVAWPLVMQAIKEGLIGETDGMRWTGPEEKRG